MKNNSQHQVQIDQNRKNIQDQKFRSLNTKTKHLKQKKMEFTPRSKMSYVAVAAFGLVLLNGVSFVAPNVPKSLMPQCLASMEMWRNGTN